MNTNERMKTVAGGESIQIDNRRFRRATIDLLATQTATENDRRTEFHRRTDRNRISVRTAQHSRSAQHERRPVRPRSFDRSPAFDLDPDRRAHGGQYTSTFFKSSVAHSTSGRKWGGRFATWISFVAGDQNLNASSSDAKQISLVLLPSSARKLNVFLTQKKMK
jgi:hypothetical protein